VNIDANLGNAERTAWNRLDVRSWPALARTRITLTGVLDSRAVEAIDCAVRAAESRRYALSLDLTHASTLTSSARDQLRSRGHRSWAFML
jgi:hypothetical protein